jgi:hypothetical protein
VLAAARGSGARVDWWLPMLPDDKVIAMARVAEAAAEAIAQNAAHNSKMAAITANTLGLLQALKVEANEHYGKVGLNDSPVGNRDEVAGGSCRRCGNRSLPFAALSKPVEGSSYLNTSFQCLTCCAATVQQDFFASSETRKASEVDMLMCIGVDFAFECPEAAAPEKGTPCARCSCALYELNGNGVCHICQAVWDDLGMPADRYLEQFVAHTPVGAPIPGYWEKPASEWAASKKPEESHADEWSEWKDIPSTFYMDTDQLNSECMQNAVTTLYTPKKLYKKP